MTLRNLLHNVARLFNTQTIFYDAFGRLMRAASRSRSSRPAHPGCAHRTHGRSRGRAAAAPAIPLMRRGMDPVMVAWDGAPLRLKLRLPRPLAALELRYRIDLESGEFLEGKCQRDSRTKPVERSIEASRLRDTVDQPPRQTAPWLPSIFTCRPAAAHLTPTCCRLRSNLTVQPMPRSDDGAFFVPYMRSPLRKAGAPVASPT